MTSAPDRLLNTLKERASARLISLVLMLGTGTVLGIAAWLEPSAEGHSTHLQLGLSRCSFLAWTGHPCPMCGATTTFALLAHFQPVAALINQPFATLLFFMTLATFGISLAEVVQPRGRWGRLLSWLEPWEGGLAVAFLTLMGVSWMYKAWMMSTL